MILKKEYPKGHRWSPIDGKGFECYTDAICNDCRMHIVLCDTFEGYVWLENDRYENNIIYNEECNHTGVVSCREYKMQDALG